MARSRPAASRSERFDLYQHVTDQIVAALDQGVRPWVKPWSTEHLAGRVSRPLRACGKHYRGINCLVLCGLRPYGRTAHAADFDHAWALIASYLSGLRYPSAECRRFAL